MPQFYGRFTTALLRRWRHIASQRGAIFYTIIESCRRRGIDPHADLCDVLTRLPRLTNWQIKPEACRPARHAA